MLALTFACTDIIDLESEREGGQLVIFGRITDGTLGNEIRITRTSISGQEPGEVLNAVVTVSDDQGNSTGYIGDGKGNYRLGDNSFVGVTGRSYHLRVELPNGQVYESRPEVMPALAASDELSFEIKVVQETSEQGVTSVRKIVSVAADTRILDQSPNVYIKWDVQEAYTFQQAVLPAHNFPFYERKTCYITNDLEQQRVELYDGSELRATEINNRSVVDRTVDDTFRGVHYFNYIQQSLTEDAHQFWLSIDKNVNRVGSIFDQPPGVIPTNLYNVNDPNEQIFGYFEVVATDTTHLKVTNSDIDQFFADPCPHDPRVEFAPTGGFQFISRFYEPECLECTVLPNSSLTRPHYFD